VANTCHHARWQYSCTSRPDDLLVISHNARPVANARRTLALALLTLTAYRRAIAACPEMNCQKVCGASDKCARIASPRWLLSDIDYRHYFRIVRPRIGLQSLELVYKTESNNSVSEINVLTSWHAKKCVRSHLSFSFKIDPPTPKIPPTPPPGRPRRLGQSRESFYSKAQDLNEDDTARGAAGAWSRIPINGNYKR